MAKHEFIETREIVYVNAPISPILQGDSVHYEDIAFKAQIGRIHAFSEQEIVKPYLEKIRAEIDELEIYYDNDYFSGNRDAMFKCSDVLQIIDKYNAESEG